MPDFDDGPVAPARSGTFSEAEINDACRLVCQMLRKNDPGEYSQGVHHYNRDYRFASLVNLICHGIGLSTPLRYGDDCLVVAASDAGSPFAMRSSFFAKADKKVKPLLLVLLHAAICSFWKDRNLFGDDQESSWITVDDVRKFAFESANAAACGDSGDGLWREIYRMKDLVEAQRASEKNLSGLAKRALNQMVEVGFAISHETDEGTCYRATKILCAHLRSPNWERFEKFLIEEGKRKNWQEAGEAVRDEQAQEFGESVFGL